MKRKLTANASDPDLLKVAVRLREDAKKCQGKREMRVSPREMELLTTALLGSNEVTG